LDISKAPLYNVQVIQPAESVVINVRMLRGAIGPAPLKENCNSIQSGHDLIKCCHVATVIH